MFEWDPGREEFDGVTGDGASSAFHLDEEGQCDGEGARSSLVRCSGYTMDDGDRGSATGRAHNGDT